MRYRNFCGEPAKEAPVRWCLLCAPARHRTSPESHGQPSSQSCSLPPGYVHRGRGLGGTCPHLPNPGSSPLIISCQPSTFGPVPFCKLTARADFQVPSLASPSHQGEAKETPGVEPPPEGETSLCSQNRTDGKTRWRLGVGTTGSSFQIPFPNSAAVLQGSQIRGFRSWGP